jgi:LacI family transcriptional regulator
VSSIDHPRSACARAIAEARAEAGPRRVVMICHDDELSYLSNGGPGTAFTAHASSIREAGRRCAEMLIDADPRPRAAPSPSCGRPN